MNHTTGAQRYNARMDKIFENAIKCKETAGKMKIALVKYDNGYTIKTNINGSDAEIKEYFAVGAVVNLGDGCGGDLLAKVVSVTIEM